MKYIALIISLFISTISYAETIEYQIYEVDKEENKRLLTEGVKDYQISDIKTKERAPGQTIYYLPLEKECSVGVVVSAEEKVTGFALQAIHSSGGFSWDWFDLEEGNRFTKRQECGEVEIKTTGLPGNYFISQVDFITDVCLRLNQSDDIDRDTHRITIKQGGTLVVLP